MTKASEGNGALIPKNQAFDILVADDQENWRVICGEIFDIAGYICDFADDASSVVDKLQSSHYKLVCVNWNLVSAHQGRALLERLCAQFPHIPVLLVTGILTGSVERLRKRYPNIKDILLKGNPYEPEDAFLDSLLEEVKDVLSRTDTRVEVPKIPGENTITWLHLSDLHFHPPDYEANVVLQDLIQDVEKQIDEIGLQPNFIVVTGDTAYTGTPKEYKHAMKFFDVLLNRTGIPKEHLFIVPGNHDVHWKSVDRTVAAGYLTTLTSIRMIDETLGSSIQRRRILQKFRYYRQFVKRYLPFRPFDEDNFFFVETMKVASKRVTLLGLNSAWMSAYRWEPGQEYKQADDRHSLMLGRSQLRDAIEEAKKQEPHLVIALMHHPTEWFKDEIDREEVEALLERNCHFVLRGHLHDNRIVMQQTPGGEAITITAGASFQRIGNTIDYNGYNLVRLELDTGIGTIYLRCYSKKYGGFWTEDVHSYPAMKGGFYTFSLPDTLLS